MSRPNPITFIRRREVRPANLGSTTQESINGFTHSQRFGILPNSIWRYPDAIAPRVHYNRLVGRYVHQEYYSGRTLLHNHQWTDEVFEMMLTNQDEDRRIHENLDGSIRKQVLGQAFAEFEHPQQDLLDLPDTNKAQM